MNCCFYASICFLHLHYAEDIDACFGHLWSKVGEMELTTLDAFKKAVEAAFQGELKCEVVELLAVGDYCRYIRGCTDSKIGRFAKQDLTQHQWKFERTPKSTEFPLGCKVQYRAYCNEKVVENQTN